MFLFLHGCQAPDHDVLDQGARAVRDDGSEPRTTSMAMAMALDLPPALPAPQYVPVPW